MRHDNDRESPAQEIVSLGREDKLFHDDRGEAYAAVTDKHAKRILKLSSANYRQWLVTKYFGQTSHVPSNNTFNSALNILEAFAIHFGRRIRLRNRFARRRDSIGLDLADTGWRAVKITPTG